MTSNFEKRSNPLLLLLLVTVFSCGLDKREIETDKKEIIVDFIDKPEEVVEYRRDFMKAVGLFYLYRKEVENNTDLIQYFDTLTYFKNQIYVLNVDGSNYRIIVKPDEIEDDLFIFTRDSIYTLKGSVIKVINYPTESIRRGERVKAIKKN